MIVSLIPDEVIRNTVLLNYELTSVRGVKKQKVAIKDFESKISTFDKIWSYDVKDISTAWLTENLMSTKIKRDVETDVYLLK